MKYLISYILFSFLISSDLQAQQLFLLAGQSNANGQGDYNKSNQYASDLAFEYDVVKDAIKPLKDPVGQKWKSLEPANTGTILPAFAQTFTNLTQQKIILLTASRGGSSCSKKAELDSYGTWDKEGQLFNQTIEKTDKAILKTASKLSGIVWMQGERDANSINDGKLTGQEYKTSLISLIKRFRVHYGKNLPFYIIQTGYQSGRPKQGNDTVRLMQKAVANELNHVFIAYTEANLFFEKKWMKDHVHYNQDGLNDIGVVVGKFIAEQVKKNQLVYNEIKRHTLWYNSPAEHWLEALPLGNGSLGAMIFGGTDVERIQFNESSLSTGTTETVGAYQPFGDIYFHWQHKKVTNYKRTLSLNDAIHTITYTVGDIDYKHEYFISYPNKALIMQVTASKPQALSANITLKDAHKMLTTISGDKLSFTGTLENKMQYEATLSIKNIGGKVSRNDTSIVIQKADTLTCYLVAGTSFLPFSKRNYLGVHPHENLDKQLNTAINTSFEQLKKTHVQDVESLYNKVSFSLGKTNDTVPTNERLVAYSRGVKDLDFEALLFHYGRYLLIASSRKGGLPANLQGIWNNEFKPAWYSQYTTNINLQMNYWLAEQTNLSECHFPLFDWVENLAAVNKTAQDSVLKVPFGWVAYSTNNLMGGPSKWRLHRPGSAWLSQHFWEHYAYTGDVSFLRGRAYPMLKDIVQYWDSHLIETKEGKLVTPDGWSPEHGPFKNEQDKQPYMGASYDQQIVFDLFSNYVAAAEVLKVDKIYRQKIETMRLKLLGLQIGNWGQLQEWMEDLDDSTDHHRHNSHMFAVHPGKQINPDLTPQLAQAAIKSLDARGNVSTGWSTAWKINIRARLQEGNKAHALIKSLIVPAKAETTSGEKAGLYMNLFDAHPPFQIDGNFGYSAGITEMLLQSQNNIIHLLPALPDDWQQGSISGIKARGNIEVQIDWQNGKLVQCSLKPQNTGVYQIQYKNVLKKVKMKAGKLYQLDTLFFN